MKDEASPYDLAGQVIGCAMRVHSTLGAGFLEKVYVRALCIELANEGLDYVCEKPLEVYYQNAVVGSFNADLVIQNSLIVEVKAVCALVPAHEVQLVNYLSATGLDDGLLLNFGSDSLTFKRKFREVCS